MSLVTICVGGGGPPNCDQTLTIVVSLDMFRELTTKVGFFCMSRLLLKFFLTHAPKSTWLETLHWDRLCLEWNIRTCSVWITHHSRYASSWCLGYQDTAHPTDGMLPLSVTGSVTCNRSDSLATWDSMASEPRIVYTMAQWQPPTFSPWVGHEPATNRTSHVTSLQLYMLTIAPLNCKYVCLVVVIKGPANVFCTCLKRPHPTKINNTIGDIVDNINSEIQSFADDTSLLNHISDWILSIAEITEDLKTLRTGSEHWLVTFKIYDS